MIPLRVTPSRRPLPRPRRIGPPAYVELSQLAKALGHPARVAIVRHLLAKGECDCGSIVGRLPLAQATVSQHLKVLKSAGLITGEVDGPRVCYCINPKAVQRIKELIGAIGAP
jgi:ArsR family transcriptional regulator